MAERGILALYVGVTFLGAALLFAVQPLVARLALPLLGGTPSVWTTAMLFFQAALLAGYTWAWLMARLRPRVAATTHVLLVAAAGATLPLAWPAAYASPPAAAGPGWLLGALAVCVGAPFFALSSAGPLLQAWLSRTDTRAGRDPYWLYAASNLGSMLALLAYPVLVEPALTLASQTLTWSIGYGLFAAAMTGAALVMARSPARERPAGQARYVRRGHLPPSRASRWVLLAFVPSSMMLAVTAHVSAELSVIPLFWVLPLAIYLASFVVAFGRWGPTATRLASRLLPWLIVAVAWTLGASARRPVLAQLILHLLALAAVALVCHGRLAADRPHPSRLTTYYLLLSIGGALGGLFNSILAPLAFDDVYEYPLVLLVAAALRTPRWLAAPADADAALVETPARRWLRLRGPSLFPALALLAGVLWPLIWDALDVDAGSWTVAAWAALRLGPAALALLAAAPWRAPFAVGLLLLLVGPKLVGPRVADVRHQSRTFFGVHRVVAEERAGRPWHKLMHGATKHGVQARDPDRALVPTSYYHPSGPVGDMLAALDATHPAAQRLAVVGLGAGAFLAHGRPDRAMTLYEIDPEVVRIASDPDHFTYLRDTPSPTTLVLGDARLTLTRAAPGAYDLILLDAFRGDAMPTHLMTREAAATYMSKLSPGGLLAVHISSWYVDLRPLLAALAEDLGLLCLVRTDAGLTESERAAHKSSSRWAALVRPDSPIAQQLQATEGWTPAERRDGVEVWTDDYSSVLVLFR